MIANSVTVSRVLLSLLLFVSSPASALFAVSYLLCGLTDILDGFLARKLHTESRTGEWLDSAADLFFAAAYAVKIFPLLRLPAGIWLWTAVIAVIKTFGILKQSKKERKLCIAHSFANKLTGLLIFLLPLSIYFFDSKYGAIIVCAAATFAAMQELFSLKG